LVGVRQIPPIDQISRLSGGFTTLIQLNPEQSPTEGETAGRAVLGEAGTKPAEKQSP
jgi:hypothetical protein